MNSGVESNGNKVKSRYSKNDKFYPTKEDYVNIFWNTNHSNIMFMLFMVWNLTLNLFQQIRPKNSNTKIPGPCNSFNCTTKLLHCSLVMSTCSFVHRMGFVVSSIKSLSLKQLIIRISFPIDYSSFVLCRKDYTCTSKVTLIVSGFKFLFNRFS